MISRLTILAAIFAVHATSSLTFAASSHHDALKDTRKTRHTVCRTDGGAPTRLSPLRKPISTRESTERLH
jgi:hypothetical protein